MLPGDSFDERLLRWVDEHRLGWLNSFSIHLLHLSEASWFWMTAALVGLAAVIYLRAWRVGLAAVLAGNASGFTASLLKEHFERARPSFPDALIQVAGYAMPSSHAAFTMAPSIALLIVVVWRSRRAFVLAAAGLGSALLLVGGTMIYLGAHWATDVFAGWVLGILIGVVVGLLLRPRSRRA
ncbi:MAG: phosphatase PAP2 family protein [Aeromicrobium sp.]